MIELLDKSMYVIDLLEDNKRRAVLPALPYSLYNALVYKGLNQYYINELEKYNLCNGEFG